MARKNKLKNPDGIVIILLGFLIFIISLPLFAFQQSQKLTQTGFSEELRKAYEKSDEQQATSMIKDNRFFVKPFISDLISESISKELKGSTAESGQVKIIAEKAAVGFETIFGVKSSLNII